VTGTFNKRLAIVWLILSAMTFAYIWLDDRADNDGMLRASTVVTVSAIVIALVKVRIIFREFVMAVCLLGSYFIGSAVAC
jgi:hypothetical protein